MLHQITGRRGVGRALISTVVGVVALLAVSGAHADQAYSDPAGDSGTAPDLTAIRAGHDSAGTITFTATTNRPALAPEESISVYVDSDRNPATGLPVRGLGADHFFSHDGEYGGGLVFHITGNLVIVDFESTLSTSYANGTLQARIDRGDLADTESFRFLVESELTDQEGETLAADYAPNAAPPFEYSFASPLSLTVGKPSGTIRGPVAGKAFTVTAPVTRSDGLPFSSGTVTCKARVGTTPLAAGGRVANGSARCSMRIPRTAKGKRLRGTLTVTTAGAVAPVTKSFSYRVR